MKLQGKIYYNRKAKQYLKIRKNEKHESFEHRKTRKKLNPGIQNKAKVKSKRRKEKLDR